MSEPIYTAGPSEQFGAPAGYAPQPYPAQPQYQPAQYGGVPTPPPSNAGWAVATIVCFWPLAFAAFNHLHSIFPKWAVGDYMGAQYASERVKTLGKISVGVGIGLGVFAILMWFLLFAAFASAVNEIDTGTTYYR